MTRAVNNKFFETRDYSMFKKIRGNRPVDESHVKQLKKLIAEKDLMDPIPVNANKELEDGQHTLQPRKLKRNKTKMDLASRSQKRRDRAMQMSSLCMRSSRGVH